MSKILHQSELDDLASIDLTDEFLESNINRSFNADYTRATLNETTERFVEAFLVDQGDSIAQLHHSLKECGTVLGDMEEALQQFISQLGCIQQDIGHVREVLAETAVRLANTKATEQVLWAAVSCLIVPPEVVQVLTQTSDEQLGPQFMLCTKELLKYLSYRKGTWSQTTAAAQPRRASQLPAAMAHSGPGEAEGSAHEPQQKRRERSEEETLREVRFSLSQCRAYYDLMSILDALALYACIKIKSFLSKKLLVLTNQNTNICIQQDHVLRPCAFYVHFLRAAVPLLRHVYSAPPPQPTDREVPGPSGSPTALLPSSLEGSAGESCHADAGSSDLTSKANTTLIPYRIVRALYAEFKQEYCVLVSSIYREKIQDYTFFCNSMEYSTEGGWGGRDGASGASLWGFGGGGGGGGASATPATARARGVGGGGMGGGSANAPSYSYTLPLITDTEGGGAFLAMRLGERASILKHVFGPPLIPTMERAARRKHTYEETFRSLLSLICDIVTHEYLFTFDFFSGDMSVYGDVFRPTVQFIVDYLSEVVLMNSSGGTRAMLHERSRTSVNVKARQDTYGLFLLIRLCQEYRSMMKHTRKLSCLDGFFDSLLLLLWPPFNVCFERQLNALMSAKNNRAMFDCLNHLRRSEEKLALVHPMVKAFAEYSCVLMSLSYGAVMSDTARAAAAQREMERRHRALARQNRTAATAGAANSRDDGQEVEKRDALSSSSSTTTASSSQSSSDDVAAGVSASETPAAVKRDSVAAAAVGSPEWDMSLRQGALARIDEEQGSDAADSRSHFVTLMGDIGFMRIELAHFVVQMGEDIVAAEPNAQHRDRLRPFSKAFALNNIFYLLHFSSQYPILLVGDSGVNANGAPPSARAADSEDGDGDEARQPGDLVTLDQKDDLHGLWDLFQRYRGEFVESTIRTFLGTFLHVTQNSDECEPTEVLQAAEDFVLHWKRALDLVRQTVRDLISDPVNAQEITAQACMDILLYNTRFHTIIAKILETSTDAAAAGTGNPFHGRTLRSLVVTNQLLLQHMRTFSIPLSV